MSKFRPRNIPLRLIVEVDSAGYPSYAFVCMICEQSFIPGMNIYATIDNLLTHECQTEIVNDYPADIDDVKEMMP